MLLGRFYASGTIGYGLALIEPFQFAYLLFLMERVEWAIIPFIVANGVALVAEIPAGMLSDRWSRKNVTLLGYSLSGMSWAAIPFAVTLDGTAQLLAVCACFSVDGLGETLASGAEDAWAVDNLIVAGRPDLTDVFFARSLSFESLGGIVAGSLALAVLLSARIDPALLNILWYVTAAGQFIAIAIAARIPENRLDDVSTPGKPGSPVTVSSVLNGLAIMVRVRPLFFFSLALVAASFADSVIGDAFTMSMVTRGLDARMLAPLGIFGNAIGLLAPIIGIALARRLGLPRFLSLFLVIPAFAVCVMFADPALWVIVALCILFDFCEVLWDPVADAHLHSLIPSRHRATLASAVNQLNGLARLAGYGVFAVFLGSEGKMLKDSMPDLVDAFSGSTDAIGPGPTGILGLPLQDIAIILFTLIGLLAIPFILLASRHTPPQDTNRP